MPSADKWFYQGPRLKRLPVCFKSGKIRGWGGHQRIVDWRFAMYDDCDRTFMGLYDMTILIFLYVHIYILHTLTYCIYCMEALDDP